MRLLDPGKVAARPGEAAGRRLYFVSLGCPKNRVDSEVMLGTLAGDGYRVVDTPDDADVLVVNTCSFVDEAKEESIQTILELAEAKAEGGQKLVVSGCLAQRYAGELEAELPEVDLFIGTGEYGRIAELLSDPTPPRTAVARPYYVADHNAPRVLTTPGHTAYLRIAEGCSQRCTFCIIPQLRGKARSRPIASVVEEAEALAAQGVVELNLIAQDLTHYGDDLKDSPDDLVGLLRALAAVDGIRWIRLLYCYPHNFTDALVELIASEPKICKYVDIPLQHIADPLLARMQRRTTRAITEDLLAKLRAVDGMVIRTTFIVGHPGETEPDFQALLDFVGKVGFDRLGAFRYSQEEGTRSARQPDQVPELVKRERYHRLMELQQGIHEARMERLVGQEVTVLVEGRAPDSDLVWVGRTAGQAPEIDGITYLSEAPEDLRPGDFVQAEVVEVRGYDLVAEVLPPEVD